MTYQPGDEVRCVETLGGTKLVGGMVYTIREVEGNLLFLNEVDGGWWTYRFDKVEKPSATFVLDEVAE